MCGQEDDRITHSGRDAGPLHNSERDYLADKGVYPLNRGTGGHNSRQAKSRIKNEVLTVPGFSSSVRGFYLDLIGLSNYMVSVEESDRMEWEDHILPASKDELVRLRDHLDRLIETAESDAYSQERDSLRDSIQPLYEEPDLLDMWDVTLTGEDSENDSTSREPLSEEQMDRLFKQRRRRQSGLLTVLEKEELPEILAYIGENGECKLPNKQINAEGEYWSTVASRELCPELATVEELSTQKQEYELTEDGEAVLLCWHSLRESEPVQRLTELSSLSERESTLSLLKNHFPTTYGSE